MQIQRVKQWQLPVIRQLHYAAGEVRSYTLYFPLHRTPDGFLPFRSTPRQGKRFELLYGELPSGKVALEEFIPFFAAHADPPFTPTRRGAGDGVRGATGGGGRGWGGGGAGGAR